ncbi:MAG: hypothetical protein KJ060_06935 [Candidatus Hydrogenedentes bacterium]|nr:hypothetical protein [Candidatus Hydrogenedentota bacterium]
MVRKQFTVFLLAAGFVAVLGASACEIDIKPGSDPNTINISSNGTVAVALFSMGTIYVPNFVDFDTVVFAGAGPVSWGFEDVDGDGVDDAVFHFEVQELDLDATSTSASLTFSNLWGNQYTCTDTVRIVDANAKS